MIRIAWNNCFGNNVYHYIVTRLISEKNNMDFSYIEKTRYRTSFDPAKGHSGCVQDPIEYFNHLNINIPYFKEGKKLINLTNRNQISNLKKNHEFILTRQNSWKVFDNKEFVNNIDTIKSWFPEVKTTNYDDIVLHARVGGDVYRKNRIPDFKKIKSLLDTVKFKKIYICTDAPKDKWLNNFKDCGYDYEIVSHFTRKADVKTGYIHDEGDSKDVVSDFNFIRSFDKVALTVVASTYGFLAAALGNPSVVLYDKDYANKLSKNHWFVQDLFLK